jgi:hypothetical protein
MKKLVFIISLLFFISVSKTYANPNVYYDNNDRSIHYITPQSNGCSGGYMMIWVDTPPFDWQNPIWSAPNNSTQYGYSYPFWGFPYIFNVDTNNITGNNLVAYITDQCYSVQQQSDVFSINPPPTPTTPPIVYYNQAVQNTQEAVLGMQTSITDVFPILIAIGAVLLISVALIYWVLKKFRQVSGFSNTFVHDAKYTSKTSPSGEAIYLKKDFYGEITGLDHYEKGAIKNSSNKYWKKK